MRIWTYALGSALSLPILVVALVLLTGCARSNNAWDGYHYGYGYVPKGDKSDERVFSYDRR